MIPGWLWVLLLTLPAPQPITPQLCLAPAAQEEHMDFSDAWRKTMTWEGGDKLHLVAGDPGGTTRYGISARAHPKVDIPLLTEARAMMIAKLYYWHPLRIEQLPAALRWDIFDVGFNAGPYRATKMLQRSINLCRQAMGSVDFISEDGKMGPLTAQAADGFDENKLLRVFRAYRRDHYLALAETGRAKFIHGWLRRAEGEYNG